MSAFPPRGAGVAWLCAAALLAACPDGQPGPGPDAGAGGAGSRGKVIARLEAMKGAVTLERAGKSEPAVVTDLEIGDALETGPEAEAKVVFPGGRAVEIGPEARFVITENDTGIVLEVARGLVLSRVPADAAPSADSRMGLSILTPFGLTRVGSGPNEVSVDVRKDHAAVEVLVGNVEFVSRNGQATKAAAGDVLAAGAQVKLTPRVPLVLETIEVTLHENTGKADVRRKDSKRWQPVGKKGEAIAQGDSMRVTEGRSTLQLAGPDSTLLLQKGAELVFDSSASVGGVAESRLELKSGEIVASLADGKKSRMLVGGLELESEAGGQFTVTRTGDGYAVLATTGDLLVGRGGHRGELKAGQSARVGASGAATIADQAREELALPSRPGVRVFHPGIGRAAIVWEGEARDYRVEVAQDAAFKQKTVSGLVHQPHLNVPVPARGALFWRIFDASGAVELEKGSAVFGLEPPARELSLLRNQVPDGAEKTTIYYQDKPPAVTFVYKAEPRAAKYRVLVYRDGALDKAVVERVVKEDKAPLEAGVLEEGAYLWSVTPLSDKGEELRGGKMNKLELAYDNAVPTLVILEPRNGAVVSGAKVDVVGIAPVGAKVWVNGRLVALDRKARFETTAVPFGRPPMVVFRLVQPKGPEVLTVRTLRRAR